MIENAQTVLITQQIVWAAMAAIEYFLTVSVDKGFLKINQASVKVN